MHSGACHQTQTHLGRQRLSAFISSDFARTEGGGMCARSAVGAAGVAAGVAVVHDVRTRWCMPGHQGVSRRQVCGSNCSSGHLLGDGRVGRSCATF